MYGVPIYVFGIYKHHRTLLYSWFLTVKSLSTYRSFRRPVLIYGVVIVSSVRGTGKTFMYFIFAEFALVCGIFLEKLGVSCFVRGK